MWATFACCMSETCRIISSLRRRTQGAEKKEKSRTNFHKFLQSFPIIPIFSCAFFFSTASAILLFCRCCLALFGANILYNLNKSDVVCSYRLKIGNWIEEFLSLSFERCGPPWKRRKRSNINAGKRASQQQHLKRAQLEATMPLCRNSSSSRHHHVGTVQHRGEHEEERKNWKINNLWVGISCSEMEDLHCKWNMYEIMNEKERESNIK